MQGDRAKAGPATAAADLSPFQGLGFYTEADAKWFFGRLTERRIILAHLRTSPLTLLYAESGVGKSSLLRAGVAARIRELATKNVEAGGSRKFFPVVFSAWKDDPVDDLTSEIERQVHSIATSGNGAGPKATPSRTALADTIRWASESLSATLLIMLDQFEEHFSYRLAEREPDRLADELAECVNSPDVPANFLIAVREDVYGSLGDLFSGRIPNVYSNYLHLEYLTREAARDAIEKPVEVFNAEHDETQAITLDDDLTDAVLDEVRRGNLELGPSPVDRDGGAGQATLNADEIETPFLQLVMTRLWEHELERGSRVLRTATLNEELGGAETIVRNHVDRALAGINGEELEAATDIFRDLVTPSGVKVAHTARDLAQMTGHDEEAVVSVLRRLYDERIVRAVDPAPGTTQARYEIFHDRLAAPILDWRSQRENERLVRDKQRAELEAQTQRQQARRFRRRARIMFGMVIGLIALLVAVVVLLQYARNQSDRASREKHAAAYFGLTTRANTELLTRPDVALLLYLAAYSQSPHLVTEKSLVATLQQLQRSGAIGVLHGHTDAVDSIAFSPDSTILASAGGDKTIRLWSVAGNHHYPLGSPLRARGPLFSDAFDPTGRILASGSFNEVVLWNVGRHVLNATIPYNAGAITSVAFSRHSNLLAAGGSDGTVLLWNTATHTRRLLSVARGPGSPVRSIAFSPNGDLLAAGTGAEVGVWHVATGRQLGGRLTGPTGAVYSVAFSPDGVTLAAGGSSGNVVFWNVASHARSPAPLTGVKAINSIAFSPDGAALAAGVSGATVLWNLARPREPKRRLVGHEGGVYTVAFSPNGKLLASGAADRTVMLWNYPLGEVFGAPLVQTRAAALPLSRAGSASLVALSPDGRTVASGGNSGQVLLTDARTGALRGVLRAHDQALADIAFDPTGHLLAAAYGDGTIRLWDPANATAVGAPLLGHIGAVYSIAFNRSGTMLVSGGHDGTIRVWDVRTHTELDGPMRGDSAAVYAVTFSPDGQEIASGGDGRAIRFWSVSTHQLAPPGLIPLGRAIFTLAFSPHGRLLASGGADDVVRLWELHGSSYVQVRTLLGHSDFIRSVAFSPDGLTLASGSSDTTARLWDVATGTEIGGPLTGDTESIERVAFSRDGNYLATGSADNTVRLWQAVKLPRSFADVRNEVCNFLGAGLSRAEWSQYAPNIAFQQTCPRGTPS